MGWAVKFTESTNLTNDSKCLTEIRTWSYCSICRPKWAKKKPLHRALSKPPKEFQQNRKIIISKYKPTSYPLHSKPYGGRKWRLQCDDLHFWYNSQTKKWIDFRNYYPYTTNTAHIASIKALVRHLRKQYLPKGIQFRLSGRYIGEDYLVTVK